MPLPLGGAHSKSQASCNENKHDNRDAFFGARRSSGRRRSRHPPRHSAGGSREQSQRGHQGIFRVHSVPKTHPGTRKRLSAIGPDKKGNGREQALTCLIFTVNPSLPIVVRWIKDEGRLRGKQHVEQQAEAQENNHHKVGNEVVGVLHDAAPEGQKGEESSCSNADITFCVVS